MTKSIDAADWLTEDTMEETTCMQLPDVTGFRYIPSFVLADEAQALEGLFKSRTLSYRQILMRGQVAKRTVCCFGFDYVYTRRAVSMTEPMPAELLRLRERAEAAVNDGSDLGQAIVTSYPPGAGINWHRDAPIFGPSIVGVSFGSGARLLLKCGKVIHRVHLAPRSAYVLSGPARYEWMHRIAPVGEQRYSVTFRSLAGADIT